MERRTFIRTMGAGAAAFVLGSLTAPERTSAGAASDYVVSCFGDSTTWGANGEASGGGMDIAWPGRLKEKMGFREVYNFGKKGSRLAVTAERKDSFVERLDQVLAKPADLFLVLGGVNDFQHDVPLGSAGEEDTHTVCGAVRHIIEGILTRYPDRKLIFLTPMKNNFQHPTKHYPGSFDKNAQGLIQADYAAAIRKTCDHYSVPVIDLYAESGISPFLPAQQKRYMPDGLHYSEAGYERLAERIGGELRRFLG